MENLPIISITEIKSGQIESSDLIEADREAMLRRIRKFGEKANGWVVLNIPMNKFRGFYTN